MRRNVRIAALIVAAVSVVWASLLLVFGGIDVVVAGLYARSHNFQHPARIAAAALLVFLLTGGVAVVRDALPKLVAAWVATRRVMSPLVAAALIAVATFAVTDAFCTTTAGGADDSGYVSQADRWLNHTLTPAQPWVAKVPWPNASWTFAPLGYKPIEGDPLMRQVPTYSPGLPLMMAAAKWIGGQARLFLIVPLSAAILVLASYGIGRRLAGPAVGLIAAWFMATSPILLLMSVLPMSDVPAGAAWMGAFFFLMGEGALAAFAAGLAAALAIVIRPNLFFLAPIMGLWFLIRRGSAPASFGRRLAHLMIFGLGVAPGVIFIALLFDSLYGSPLTSGYGRFADSLDWSHVGPNLHLYWHWALEVQATVTIAGLAGIVVPFVWPRDDARRAMIVAAAMFLAVASEYCFYLVFDNWTSLRFFLPVWALLALGAASVVAFVWTRVTGDLPRAAIAIGVVTIGIVGVHTARDRSVFALWYGDRRYIAMSEIVRRLTPPNSVVFAMQESGALRYYSGRVPIRYDSFDSQWLDRGVEWLAAAGVHSYAVLESWEIDKFRDHFPDQRRVSALDGPIVVYRTYQDRTPVYLFDLTTPPPMGVAPTVITETDPWRLRAMMPGPVPTLSFQSAR